MTKPDYVSVDIGYAVTIACAVSMLMLAAGATWFEAHPNNDHNGKSITGVILLWWALAVWLVGFAGYYSGSVYHAVCK